MDVLYTGGWRYVHREKWWEQAVQKGKLSIQGDRWYWRCLEAKYTTAITLDGNHDIEINSKFRLQQKWWVQWGRRGYRGESRRTNYVERWCNDGIHHHLCIGGMRSRCSHVKWRCGNLIVHPGNRVITKTMMILINWWHRMQLLLGDGDSMSLERAHGNSELNKMTNWVYCPSSCMSFQVSAPVFGYSGTGKQAWCMLTLHYTEPEVTLCWCNVVSYACISWIIYGPMGSCELSQSIS